VLPSEPIGDGRAETGRPGRKGPSRPWVGGLLTGLLYVQVAWILVYTLLDVPFVEALGAWNYVGNGGLTVVVVMLGRAWRGAPYTRPTSTSRI
jgi:hypothetical protein